MDRHYYSGYLCGIGVEIDDYERRNKIDRTFMRVKFRSTLEMMHGHMGLTQDHSTFSYNRCWVINSSSRARNFTNRLSYMLSMIIHIHYRELEAPVHPLPNR